MKFISTSFTLTAAFVSAALAAPATTERSLCDVSDLTVTGATLPAQLNPTKFLVFGTGTQNYTCGTTGVFASTGAVANLFDISCSFDPAYGTFKPQKKLGHHFFITNPITGTGINPKWDFTSSLHNDDAFVVGARSAGIPAPSGSKDVDWLYLTNIQGELADEIFRTNTSGGQPPASCTPGTPDITVPYTAIYWLTKESA